MAGMAGIGKVGTGGARQAWLVMAWRGGERTGMAWRGRQGRDCRRGRCGRVCRRKDRQGRQGAAWSGEAGGGGDWHGRHGAAGKGMAWLGAAGNGRHGGAGRGQARRGAAWTGEAGRARVAKLVNARDLKSLAARLVGSTPAPRTIRWGSKQGRLRIPPPRQTLDLDPAGGAGRADVLGRQFPVPGVDGPTQS